MRSISISARGFLSVCDCVWTATKTRLLVQKRVDYFCRFSIFVFYGDCEFCSMPWQLKFATILLLGLNFNAHTFSTSEGTSTLSGVLKKRASRDVERHVFLEGRRHPFPQKHKGKREGEILFG